MKPWRVGERGGGKSDSRPYLSHAAPKASPASVGQDAFRRDGQAHALVRVLADQHAQLGLDLKQHAAALNFADVGVVDDVEIEKVSHLAAQVLKWLLGCQARVPRPKES